MQRSKTYRAAAETFDQDELYAPLAAIKIAKGGSKKKFDETVDVVMRLGVDPRKADQMVRGTVNLPHGTGKTARVLVFANGDKADAAREAGADVVGGDELIEKVTGGWLDFDAVVATPDMMGKVGRLGRVLGPRWPDAEPEDRHRDARRRQGRHRHQGRQDRVPRRPPRQPALHHRQGVLLRGPARGELRRRPRGGAAAQAGQLQGPLHQEDHRLHDDGPRRPGRPQPHQERRRPRTTPSRPDRVAAASARSPLAGGRADLHLGSRCRFGVEASGRNGVHVHAGYVDRPPSHAPHQETPCASRPSPAASAPPPSS